MAHARIYDTSLDDFATDDTKFMRDKRLKLRHRNEILNAVKTLNDLLMCARDGGLAAEDKNEAVDEIARTRRVWQNEISQCDGCGFFLLQSKNR